MNRLNKFLSVFYLLFFFSLPVSSQEKVFFIDIDSLIQNSNVGKKVLTSISNQDKKNIELLNKKNKILEDLEAQIKNKKNVISEKDFNIEVRNFKKKVQDFTNDKNEIVNNFNKTKKNEIEKLFASFNPIISNYMNTNNINVLLDSKNVFMGNPKFNITNDILKIINKELN